MSTPLTPPDPGQASNPYAPGNPGSAPDPYATPQAAPGAAPAPYASPYTPQTAYSPQTPGSAQAPYTTPATPEQVPYQQSPYQQVPHQQTPVGTDGVSIAALVTGIVGTGPVALVLGIVGLNRVKKSGRAGKGMAITGVILGALGTAVLITVIVLFAMLWSNDEAREVLRDSLNEAQLNTDDGAAAAQDDLLEAPSSWETGTCLQIPTDLSTAEAPLGVDCAGEHNGEVYAAQTVDAADYPGENAVVAQADEFCGVEFPASLTDGSTLIMPTYVYYYPTSESWLLGDTEISCIAVEDDLSSWTGPVLTP